MNASTLITHTSPSTCEIARGDGCFGFGLRTACARSDYGAHTTPEGAEFMLSLGMQGPVVLYGASGFVGTAVATALQDAQVSTAPLAAPRLAARPLARAHEVMDGDETAMHTTRKVLQRARAVVNCAGIADASSSDESQLAAANATLPLLIGRTAEEAGCRRYVHVSSAAVQGRAAILDETTSYDPFSSYARSKIAGEAGALRCAHANVYRPPAVHGRERRVTQGGVGRTITVAQRGGTGHRSQPAGTCRQRWLSHCVPGYIGTHTATGRHPSLGGVDQRHPPGGPQRADPTPAATTSCPQHRCTCTLGKWGLAGLGRRCSAPGDAAVRPEAGAELARGRRVEPALRPGGVAITHAVGVPSDLMTPAIHGLVRCPPSFHPARRPALTPEEV